MGRAHSSSFRDRGSMAAAVLAGDAQAIVRLGSSVIPLVEDVLIERSWAGSWLLLYKNLAGVEGRLRPGEAIEFSATPRTPPCVAVLPDGSKLELPHLLAAAPTAILGETTMSSRSGVAPLLMRLVSVRGPAPVEALPPGCAQVFLVIGAEPGATLRLGFSRRPGGSVRERVQSGFEAQRELLGLLAAPGVTAAHVQRIIISLLYRRATIPDARDEILPFLSTGADETHIAELLSRISETHWWLLEHMNEVPLQPGRVLQNAAGEACTSDSLPAPYAFWNPDGKEMLLLEFRRPSPSSRLWDPLLPADEAEVARALEFTHTDPSQETSFVREPELVGAGVWRVAETPFFVVDGIECAPGISNILEPMPSLQVLHATSGEVHVHGHGTSWVLRRGQTALIPAVFGAVAIQAGCEGAELVRASFPSEADGEEERHLAAAAEETEDPQSWLAPCEPDEPDSWLCPPEFSLSREVCQARRPRGSLTRSRRAGE